MKLGIPIYQGVNLLDVAGPLEMFYWADDELKNQGRPESERLTSVLISEDGKTIVESINGVKFMPQESFAQAPTLDILWVPGGDPDVLGQIMSDPQHPYLKYLRQVAAQATWVCSVCEGALLLARADLLDGHEATTHWFFVKCLQEFPITVDTEHKRFVESVKQIGGKTERRLTGGGISSGLDEALKLIMLLYGENVAKAAQRSTQYYPDPPVTDKLPDKIPDCIVKWK